ncbi:unnamed protein product [Paramecium sonneborni]|uniref:Uncharacterized protein n=1 Tax=Paramecium sonneborni TaxID=65129 RepID=A0A8S1RV95_9CILI|nr:unnamed protein product [Paramecium sonneborni]
MLFKKTIKPNKLLSVKSVQLQYKKEREVKSNHPNTARINQINKKGICRTQIIKRRKKKNIMHKIRDIEQQLDQSDRKINQMLLQALIDEKQFLQHIVFFEL